MTLKQTPSQTIGPYFRYALTPESYGHLGIANGSLLTPGIKGEKIRIAGRVFDGANAPMADALVEIWQADSEGAYPEAAEPGKFAGFGRVETDKTGTFRFETVKPGAVPGRGNAWQAPHIAIILSARGMLGHVFTRLYFADETDANTQDPVLNTVPAERRKTLVATRDADGIYRFDIHVQGDNETVFFEV
jgi:protocatechuate 3,4-dioxygenase alpha subunit